MQGEEKYGIGNKLAYGLGNIADMIAYQSFTLLIFVFYYSIVGLDTFELMIGFIIWSIWNSINDPLLGLISDKTNVKMGRRKFWIIISVIPLSLIMLFLWTPPLGPKFLPETSMINWIYFMVVIILFDFFYTMFSLNFTSLFPEMYIEQSDRNEASLIRRVMTILGLIIAFILPVAIIGDTKDIASLYNGNYFIAGLTSCIIIFVSILIAIKYAVKERPIFRKDPLENPGFTESLKICLSNRTFLVLIAGNLCNWYVYGLIPTIILLYGTHVLGSPDLASSLLLLMGFLSAAGLMPIWKKIGDTHGNQKGITISFLIWGTSFIPFLFIFGHTLTNYIITLIAMIYVGFGISGSIYFVDLLISDVIDEDEVATGVRREGAYYGVNALIIRLATIFVMLTIAMVFSGTGWTDYQPVTNDIAQLRLGLMLLMSIFPSAAAFLGAFCFYKFPLKEERLVKMKAELSKLHETKARGGSG
ncbi:MAG: MFS transporter [Candidatus Helarchaeota archaeon]